MYFFCTLTSLGKEKKRYGPAEHAYQVFIHRFFSACITLTASLAPSPRLGAWNLSSVFSHLEARFETAETSSCLHFNQSKGVIAGLTDWHLTFSSIYSFIVLQLNSLEPDYFKIVKSNRLTVVEYINFTVSPSYNLTVSLNIESKHLSILPTFTFNFSPSYNRIVSLSQKHTVIQYYLLTVLKSERLSVLKSYRLTVVLSYR